MEELTLDQDNIGQEIERLIRNFKKDGEVRKTSEYLTNRLTALEELWQRFEENNEEIHEIAGEHQEHPYFRKHYYEKVKAGYVNLQDELTTRLTQLAKNPIIQEAGPSTKGVTTTLPPESIKTLTQPDKESRLQQVGTSAKEHIAETPADKQQPKTTRKQPQFAFGEDKTCDLGDTTRLKQLVKSQQAVMKALAHNLQEINARGESSFSKPYCELKIQAINNYWADISSNNCHIWAMAEEDEPFGYTFSYYCELEAWVHETLINLRQSLGSSTLESHSVQRNTHLKLPKVTLPVFNGDYLKWNQFRELYVQMIHSQPLSKSEKMYYLNGNLVGEAKALIQHLMVSDQNYDTAWQILENRYNNERLLITALLNKLLSQPAIVTESAHAIKSLHDTTKECILGIKNLGINVDSWDALLLHLILKKVDRATHALYEQTLDAPRVIQSFNKFLEFLELRFQALEAISSNKRNQVYNKNPNIKSSAFIITNTMKRMCKLCKQGHALYACQRFLKLNPSERQQQARKLQVCTNCLRDGHVLSKCTSRGCSKCQAKHNTLLHVGISNQSTQPPIPIEAQSSSKDRVSTNLAAHTTEDLTTSYVFLGTALVHLLNKDGQFITCRALLDSGSQLNFITEGLCKLLRLPLKKGDVNINGIGNSSLKTSMRTNVTISSMHTGYTTTMEVFVITDIAANQPQQFIKTNSWPIPSNIHLADPEFNQPQRVDLLIGAEFYPELLSSGQIKLHKQLPSLQNTVFGWVVVGKISNATSIEPFCGISRASLDNQLQRFWELEEVESPIQSMTLAERECETFFERTTERDKSGRFIVKLPFKERPETLGNSDSQAIRRFLSLERRLIKNPELKSQYVAFMDEYRKLDHMEVLKDPNLPTTHYFIPHHCVLKPDSSTTKLRVVFNASARTTSNKSLNDVLLKGPVLQDELFSILLRFRMHKYVITGDIEKMYRQVLLSEEDRNFQLILWRDEPGKELQVFRLNTVTYGTTSAPYLATKCLQVLALEGAQKYPLGAKTIKRDFYVDDLMTGSDSLKEALEIQQQTSKLLATAGFHLRKWCANHPKLLNNIPKEDIELELGSRDTETETKTLGLLWKPASDVFSIRVLCPKEREVTKRNILAETAQLFDPLGFVNPVIVKAKILLQRLWLLKLDWDAALPLEIVTQWTQFRRNLNTLKDLTLPRHVLVTDASMKTSQLHGFADASENAYAAVIYVRSIDKRGAITSRLLCAKSRVAPVKKQTLPRLELCAAKLLAQLMNQVQKSVQFSSSQLYYWSDSSIVLSWIRSESSSFKTFVANRIAVIHELTDPNRWSHVRSEQNPADVGSRGASPEELCASKLWFNGPHFLRKTQSEWPNEKIVEPSENTERKETKTILVTSSSKTSVVSDINHRNSFTFLQRTMAYVLRFMRNLRTPRNNSNCKSRLSGPLKVEELQGALEVIIKAVQTSHFFEELKKLRKNKVLDTHSKLSSLTPFIDSNGIMRVGGRLQASSLKYDNKHPIILPHSDAITRLLLHYLHIKHLHAGPQALLAITRQQFWPLRGKTLANSVVHQCLRCARVKPKNINQLMGNLPAERIQQARPFTNVGIDFCGPIYIHYKLRGKRPTKAYIAVFVCFATKAVHLEVVSDLTSAAFIAALKRFTGRRGKPAKIFCDNATNFVGAKNELLEIRELIQRNEKEITDHCSQERIDWRLIPPRSPHFGGLWESAVKSTKHHLIRVLMGTSPTYEELSTVIVEIEAILNSRPITPLSDNPNDLQALTPGHFLIGEPLTSLGNSETHPGNLTLSKRWNIIQNIQQEFWRRWSKEYLQELQSRNKWRTMGMPIKPGMLVLLKEDNLPPLKWQMARVIKEYKGKDGLTRVVELKNAKGGTTTRAITKICPLPIDTLEDEPETHTREPFEQTVHIAVTEGNCLQEIDKLKPTVSMSSKGPLPSSQDAAMIKPQQKNYLASKANLKTAKGVASTTSTTTTVASLNDKQAGYSDISSQRTIFPITTKYNAASTISTTSSHLREPDIRPHPTRRRLKRRIAPINPAWLSSPHLRGYNKQPRPDLQIESEPDGKDKTKAKLAQTILSTLLVLNLFSPTFGQTLKPSVETIPFQSNTGLYFEGLGQVHMITDEWNIIAYYNLEGYWKELNGLRNCLKQLTTLCEHLKSYEEHCTIVSAQLKHQLADIEHGNEILLKTNEASPIVRMKRSPLDIIGSISNKLFGILDQEYAERMSKTIETIETNENHLLDLIKNQTSLMDSTINIMKKSEEHIHSQFIHINDHIEELSATIENVTDRINAQKFMQVFNSLSIYTTLIIIGYERVQAALIEVFTDTRTGRLNPLLVTPQQLRQELSLIRENLPSSLSLPEQLLANSDTINLYNIMTVQARITTKHAIFSIKVPLIHREVYEAYHIVPIPMKVNNNTFVIKDSANFLIVNLLHDHYYPMSERDFSNCLKGITNNYMCRQHGTMYYKSVGKHQCELELLNQATQLPSTCSFTITNSTRNWVQLYNSNNWIYSLTEETTINGACGKSTFQKRLQGQGLLTLKTNCVLRANMITISSHNQQPFITQSSFASSLIFNVSDFEALHKPSVKTRTTGNSSTSTPIEDLNTLQDLLHQLKTQQRIASTKDISSTNAHQFSISYLALVLAVLICIYFMITKLRLCSKGHPSSNDASTPPQPAPRRNFEFHI